MLISGVLLFSRRKPCKTMIDLSWNVNSYSYQKYKSQKTKLLLCMKFLKGCEWSMYFFIVIFWFFIQLWYSPTAYFLSCVLLFLHVIKGNSSKNSPYNRINLFLCKFSSYCNIPIMYSHIACRDIKGFMFVPLRIRNIMEKMSHTDKPFWLTS